MAIEIRRGDQRGHFDHGWLKTYHSFSFADYFDPDHVQFGPLRVLNEDFVEGGHHASQTDRPRERATAGRRTISGG